MSDIDKAWDLLEGQILSDDELIQMTKKPDIRQAMMVIWGPKPWPKPGSIPDDEERRGDPDVLRSYELHSDGWHIMISKGKL